MIPAPGAAGSVRQWWSCILLISMVAVTTRLCNIDQPAWVSWDETHFGKMASWYINGTYFFDVHPPLGKLLIALAGSASGYNGSFAFLEPGYLYNDTNYVGMRAMCACMGAAVSPMSFVIVFDLTHSLTSSIIASLLVALDVGLITLSRFILLDPVMLFFIVASTMFNFRFNKFPAFSVHWWFHLLMTGLMLGCAVAVKFVGVFVVVAVGLYTLHDLWDIFCNVSLPLTATFKHLCARILCLICVPVVLYVCVYAVHDKLLNKVLDPYGLRSDGWLSSGYQMCLHGNDMYNISQPKYLAYGSLVSLQSAGSYRTYLHSHNISYPDSKLPNITSGLAYPLSRIHSVTGYRLKDANNFWRIEPFDEEEIPGWRDERSAAEPVLNGDLVRLVHNLTGRVLAVYNRPALGATTQKLLGGANMTDVQSYQTAFSIQSVDGLDEDSWLEAINSTFRLYNSALKCAVYSTEEKLPQWAAGQIEMICSKRLMDEGARWIVQRHINPRLASITSHWRRFRSNFWQRLVESHQIISTTNAKLKPNAEERFDSDQPWMWPVLFRGLHFSAVPEHRVYLLGNPIIWWTNLAALLISGWILAYVAYSECRRSGNISHCKVAKSECDGSRVQYRLGCAIAWLMLFWGLHYWPFWTMGRILYFHHYFPALCYSCMLTGVVCDILWHYTYVHLAGWSLRRGLHITVVLCCVCVLIVSFYLFSPLAYGMSGARPKDAGANSTYHSIWWLKSWDI